MFRACLALAGSFAAGVATGQLLKLEHILLRSTYLNSKKTVSATDEIGKQTLVEKKDSQESAPQPLEPSKVQALKEKYTFEGAHYPPDFIAAEDIKLGNFVECPADNNPHAKFQTNWKITGLKDPCACEAVRQVVLENIGKRQNNLNDTLEQLYNFKQDLCFPLISNLDFQIKDLQKRAVTADEVWKDERLNKALDALYSYSQPNALPDIRAVKDAHYQLKGAKIPLNNEIVFRAIPKQKDRL
jgi:hypothetical protein